MHEDTLAVRRRVLPVEHPDTLESMSVLASYYSGTDREFEALRLREETLAVRKRILPLDHPDTLESMHLLALSYTSLKRHAEAFKLFEEALAAQNRVLPPDHPDLLGTMFDLANTYILLNRHADALPLINQILGKANRPEVFSGMFPSAIGMRLECYQKVGDVAGCRATAELLEKRGPTDVATIFTAASCRAVTASLQAKAKKPDAARLAKEEADKAMTWLIKVVAADWPGPDVTNFGPDAFLEILRKDTQLDFLRDREDFKKLIAEFEKKAKKK